MVKRVFNGSPFYLFKRSVAVFLNFCHPPVLRTTYLQLSIWPRSCSGLRCRGLIMPAELLQSAMTMTVFVCQICPISYSRRVLSRRQRPCHLHPRITHHCYPFSSSSFFTIQWITKCSLRLTILISSFGTRSDLQRDTSMVRDRMQYAFSTSRCRGKGIC